MLNVVLFLTLALSCSTRQEEQAALILSSEFNETSVIPFHEFPISLKMVIPPAPVLDLFERWQDLEDLDVVPSQDSSIYVLYPIEYSSLREKLNHDEIMQIAQQYYLQNSRLVPVCIGEWRGDYLVLLRSSDLKKIRIALQKIFITRGGDPQKFNAANYTPYLELTESNIVHSFPLREKGCSLSLDMI